MACIPNKSTYVHLWRSCEECLKTQFRETSLSANKLRFLQRQDETLFDTYKKEHVNKWDILSLTFS